MANNRERTEFKTNLSQIENIGYNPIFPLFDGVNSANYQKISNVARQNINSNIKEIPLLREKIKEFNELYNRHAIKGKGTAKIGASNMIVNELIKLNDEITKLFVEIIEQYGLKNSRILNNKYNVVLNGTTSRNELIILLKLLYDAKTPRQVEQAVQNIEKRIKQQNQQAAAAAASQQQQPGRLVRLWRLLGGSNNGKQRGGQPQPPPQPPPSGSTNGNEGNKQPRPRANASASASNSQRTQQGSSEPGTSTNLNQRGSQQPPPQPQPQPPKQNASGPNNAEVKAAVNATMNELVREVANNAEANA